MIDVSTQKPLQVQTGGTAGPYILVPVGQLELVRALLDRHGIAYWVDPVAVALDNKPAITAINLGREGDPSRVQAILDNVN